MNHSTANLVHSIDAQLLTQTQESMLVYDALLGMAKELELDPALEPFRSQIERDLAEFEEEYPEIVSEYLFTKRA